jgi:hypothetical protein
VITDDEVMRLFERADPARVNDRAPVIDAAGDLDTLRTRSIHVTLTETPPRPTGPTSRHRWRIIAAVAAAVVLVAGGALVLAARDDPADPTTTDQVPRESGAEQVARGFVEAYGAFDADRVETYLSDDAVFLGLSEVLPRTPEERRLALSMLEAVGYKQSVVRCLELDSSAAGTRIRCTFDFHALRSDEIAKVRTEPGGNVLVGVGPYSGSYFDLTVRDGQIVQAGLHLATEEFWPQMWEPFEEWVTHGHPEDVAVMYERRAGDRAGQAALDPLARTWWRLSEESIRLWGQHTREFIASGDAYAQVWGDEVPNGE